MSRILRGLTRRGRSRASAHSPSDSILNLLLHHDWGEKGRWNSYQWAGDKDRGRTSSNPEEGPTRGTNDVTRPRPHRARPLSRSRPAVPSCACVTLHPTPGSEPSAFLNSTLPPQNELRGTAIPGK